MWKKYKYINSNNDMLLKSEELALIVKLNIKIYKIYFIYLVYCI